MPYDTLPDRLKDLIPSAKGQEMFRNVVNSQLEAGESESVAFASAWAALDRAGYSKGDDGKWIKKASGAKPIYLKREVLNAERIHEWAAEQGFTTALPVDDMHVTVVYSKDPFSVELTEIAESIGSRTASWDNVVVRGGHRSVERLGDEGEAVVLRIECPELSAENAMYRSMGASSSWPDYKAHITISWNASDLDVQSIEPFMGNIVLGALKASVLDEDWQDDLEEVSLSKSSESYDPPESARNNARKVLRWKKEHGDDVKGMTQVGWARANQLASGEKLSRETVGRMSQFARHRKNSEVDPKYKNEPWKDAGYVAWLGWGGDSGVNWAQRQVKKYAVSDDAFSMPQEAQARSVDLGFGGEIHIAEAGNQRVFMPGANQSEFLNEPCQEKGLLERGISAIISTIMGSTEIHKSANEAKILKLDDEQRIVWGWAYVSTENGELLSDTQGDSIEPAEMEKMANDFMLGSRSGKAMHAGEDRGTIIHSLPLTAELMKAFGIKSDREGWIIGYKVRDDKVWEMVKSGKFTGFSIGGKAADTEDY
jgi:cation transport regulator ChaB